MPKNTLFNHLRKPSNLLFFLLSVLLCTACARMPAPIGKPLPTLTFHTLSPLSVQGGSAHIKMDFSQAKEEADFILSPREVVADYVSNRFNNDRNDPVTFVVDVLQVDLVKALQSKELLGALNVKDDEIYTLVINVALFPVKDGYQQEPYQVTINRKLILSEYLSLSEKEIRQFEFLEKSIHDLDKAMSQIINERLQS